MLKRYTKVYRVLGIIESVCESVRRETLAFVPIDEKEYWVHLDSTGRLDF